MDLQTQQVHDEIIDLHRFFVDWFHGTIDRETLEPLFLSHLADDFTMISPDGNILGREQLGHIFTQTYGTNKAFKIEIRDIKTIRKMDRFFFVSYTEWQYGARASSQSQNARVSSVLIEIGTPLLWHYIHETWLADNIRAAGPSD